MMWYRIMEAIGLLTMSVEDFRKRRLPLWMLTVGCLMICGYPIAKIVCENGELFSNVLQGMFPGIILLVIAILTRKIGYADGVVFLALGAAHGREGVLFILMCSLLGAAFVSVCLLAVKKADRFTKIPYLPFVFAGWLVWILKEGML